MRNWSLSQGDPLYLTLAADSRFTTPDYGNDHIWELELGTGEPRVLAVHTTYGLRARSMRIFPRFTEAKHSISDPGKFHTAPRVRRYYPNFLMVDFVPLENLSVSAEYWIPESHALAGRLTLINESTKTRLILLEVCGILAALDGRGLTPTQQQMVNVLAGQTSGLTPVIFMTGGARHGPGPNESLLLEVELGPGARRTLGFAEAALTEIPASFELARHAAARSWEAERSRIEMQNESDVMDIHTGDPNWDAALEFSQKAALGLFFRGNQHLPQPSFVLTRQPDHGFSHRLDGSDYPPVWNGQPIYESVYLADILRGRLQTTKGLVLNFLSSQSETGEVDYKPGLAGQRGKLQAAPLLASLAWSYFEATGDLPFLQETYSKLMEFLRSWFEPAHDRDRNGVPEWDHPLQTGFEDNPLFDVWQPWSQGLDISTVQSPSLMSMLHREARSLIKILQQLNQPEGERPIKPSESNLVEPEIVRTDTLKKDLSWLETQVKRLETQVEESWDDQLGLYTYRDRETGLVQRSRLIAERIGNGDLRQAIPFDQPARLMIIVQTESASTTRPIVELSENGTQGLTETIDSHRFQLRSGGLIATSTKIYRQLDRFKVEGLGEADRIFIRTANTQGEDLTLAMPLWAQIPGTARAARIIHETIMDEKRFASPYGLAALSRSADKTTTTSPAVPGARAGAEAEGIAMSVHLPWNAMIAEGVLGYGGRREAADLTTRLMKAVILNLKSSHSFYQNYHAERGAGIGERNTVHGLAPVGLFLDVLGVRNISSRSVHLDGRNPFPWPVTINYKGVTVLCGLDRTVITFPNGKNIIVEDPAPCIVRM